MNNTQNKIGKILTNETQRDAIHIAVLPVISDEKLYPCQRIGLINGKASQNAKHIGIVDPFLSMIVFPGQQFYMFMYPNTITNMRHHWEHPSVNEPTISMKIEAEKWLRKFAEEWNMDFQIMIEDAQSGEYLVARDADIHSWNEIDDGGVEFWHQLEIYTNCEFSTSHREKVGFSCSC